jgi:hypothetical protein
MHSVFIGRPKILFRFDQYFRTTYCNPLIFLTCCEISGYHSGAAEESNQLGYNLCQFFWFVTPCQFVRFLPLCQLFWVVMLCQFLRVVRCCQFFWFDSLQILLGCYHVSVLLGCYCLFLFLVTLCQFFWVGSLQILLGCYPV